MTRRPITAYLVDDEPPALSRLRRLLEQTGRVAVAGESTDPHEALAYLQQNAVDLAFFDIRMPGMTGLELCAHLDAPPPVVFTTAYEEYALRAFEVHAIDYLLKPIDRDKLARALDKHERLRALSDETMRRELDGALSRMADMLTATAPRGAQALGPPRLASRVGERLKLVDATDISHIVSEDKLVCAATEDKSYVLDQSIAELESRLSSHGFIRVHRSALLNLAWLAEIHPGFAGRAHVVLRDRHRTMLDVSRSRVRALKRAAGLQGAPPGAHRDSTE